MEVSGQITANCAPEDLIAVLYDGKVLERLMPSGALLDTLGPGRFSFSLSRSIGPIKLTLPGQITLTAKGAGHDQLLSLRAAHIIGGKVDLDLDLGFTSDRGKTRLAYAGVVHAMGLSGRVVRDHRARLNGAIRAAMVQIKTHAEARAHQTSPRV